MRVHLKRVVLVACAVSLVGFVCFQFLDADRAWGLALNGQRVVRGGRAFSGGASPIPKSRPNVWEFSESNDRILDQMNFSPRSYEKYKQMNSTKPKVIYVHGGIGDFGAKLGNEEFQRQGCTVQNCFLTEVAFRVAEVDAVLFRQAIDADIPKANPDQLRIFFSLEAPYSLPDFQGLQNVINWTATYRQDSTIVAPYARWLPHDPPVNSPSADRNFAAGKTKQVAWFVSNCGANNNRLEYAKELSKYIDVDIFGLCGNDECPKHHPDCWEKLNEDYKFYLSFENSNCRDYITEKFFQNGLGYDVIPIVMGARPEDYRKVAPPNSYINVEDFADPKSLAEYLNKLDNNDKMYNQYFRWKGTGKFINTKFWCRVCALLNDEEKPTKIVSDLQEWWNGEGICRQGPWTSKRKV